MEFNLRTVYNNSSPLSKKITFGQLVGLIALQQLGWLVCNIKYGPLHNLRANFRLVAENPSMFCAFLEVAENCVHYMIDKLWKGLPKRSNKLPIIHMLSTLPNIHCCKLFRSWYLLYFLGSRGTGLNKRFCSSFMFKI